MRIVVDLQACQNGSRHRGIGRYASSMVKAMIRSGRKHDYVIALNRSFPDAIEEVRRSFDGLLPPSAIVTYSVPPMATAADPLNAWRNRAAELVRAHFLESLSPDVVFVPSPFEGFWDDTIVSVEKNAPYLTAITLHDLIPLEDPARYLGGEHDRAAYFRCLNDARHADLLLAVSRYAGNDAIAKIGIPDHKVVVAHCGVDDLFRAPDEGAIGRSDIMAKYGIERPYVMTASPLEPRKNIEGLIAGFASMSKDVRDAHQLVLLGKMDTYAKRYIGDLARGEGLGADSVILAGFVPDEDLPILYHHSSVFGFPSFSEGFGLPLLEAMACGAPVVGSSRTSIPEVLGRPDLECDPDNVVEIGRTIERILTNPALQQELREFGPRRAELFTWDKSAAVALDAMEALHRERAASATVRAEVGQTEAGNRTALAFVMTNIAADHRLAGLNNAIAANLADRFDVTVVAGHAPVGEWLRANCPIRSIDWLEAHADHFDHIIYSADCMADAAFRRLMRRQKGELLLAERLSPPAGKQLTGYRLFDGAELAMFESRGFEGLARLVADEVAGDDMAALLFDDLVARSAGLYLEADSALSHPASRLAIMPIMRSDRAQRAFFDRVGLNGEQSVVAAIAQDEDAATRIIQLFRTAFAGAVEKPILALVCGDRDARGEISVDKLVSDVIRVGCDLDFVYSGLLSSADVLIVDDALPDGVKTRIGLDYPRAQTLLGKDLTPSALAGLLASLDPDRPGARNLDVTGAGHPNAMEAAARIGRQPPVRSMNGTALKRFVAHLPEEVRGVRPDGNDLAKVAASLARNEELERSPQIYVDVTAFAKGDASHRLDRIARDWLRAIFRQSGRNVRAVFVDGANIVVANQFAAAACGIVDSCLKDQLLRPKIGDRIVGFDLFHSFANGSFDALRAARNDGVALNYVVMENFAFQRDSQISPFAGVISAWLDETSLSNDTRFAGLPQTRDKAEARRRAARDARVQALTDAGIPLSVLHCPDLVGEGAISPDSLANIGPGLSGAIDVWLAAKRKPVALVENHASAADMGHVVTGHILGSYSLAIINRVLATTLETGFKGQARFEGVETVPINHTEGVPANEKPLMIDLTTRPVADRGNEVVISQHYPVLVPDGAYRLKIALFAWEESAVPDHTIHLLARNFDAIISPARTVTNALVDSGLSIPVATIGQPVDVEPYAALASARKPRGQEIRFLHVSSCFKRKGVDVLLEAWAKAFTSADPVCLVIKTFPNPHNDVEEQLERLATRYPDLARVEIINRDVEREELVDFYADADVMVLPSRGEGYNLPALEAMASGLPLIVTGHGGQRDFCSDKEARLIGYRFASSESHVSGHHSLWVEPDVEDLAAALREQVDPQQAATIEGRRQRALLAAAREVDRTAWLHRYSAMVETLLNESNRETARVAWISTWGVQCGIAQYSQYLIEHFSPAAQRAMTVICDHRTEKRFKSVTKFIPAWPAENIPKIDQILDTADQIEAEAIVIQHQDGLLSWDQLGRLALDDRLAGKVTVVILHNAGNMERADGQEVATVLQGLGKFSKILVHNIADLNFLTSMGLKQNVGLLPHGAFAREQAPWPRRFGPQDAPIIGCHGFFFRHKGIDRLIRAVALLRKAWPNIRLRLVNATFPGEGNDAYVNECKALARSLGVYDCIEWYPDFMPIEQINSLLGECDIIALPYGESSDSASGAVRVSLASMVPLVATRVKIFSELGDAAAWADSNDPEILADVIGSLLESPEKRRTVQAAMHEWLSAHDWNRVAGTLEGMIQGLVQEKRYHWDFRRNEL